MHPRAKSNRQIVARAARGFTLIELITVIVVLSILAVGTTGYIINSAKQYTQSAQRLKLAATGRVAIEQVSRRLRNALPNSVIVSADGSCIEYFPVVAATLSRGVIPDPVPAANPIPTANFDLQGSLTETFYAVIYPISAADLYTGNTNSGGVIATTTLSPGLNQSNVPLAADHEFSRRSPTERLFIVQSPERFCITDIGELYFYSGYGISDHNTPVLSNAPSAAVSAKGVLVADKIEPGSSDFFYSSATLVRNAKVEVTLNLLSDGDPLALSHNIQIRNLP